MISATSKVFTTALRNLSILGLFGAMSLHSAVAQSFDSYFDPGPHSVTQIELGRSSGAPVEFRAFYPDDAGDQSLTPVFLLHGFLVQNQYYDGIAKHLASHGYLVVSPQMYSRSPLPFGKPSLNQEAETAFSFLTWAQDELALQIPVSFNLERTVLIGHSRGGHVAWNMYQKFPIPVALMIGLDPVDGDGSDAITKQPLAALPSLTFGLAQSGSCAPADRNYENFFNQTDLDKQHWLIIAQDYGHMDFLTQSCGLPCNFCNSGLGGERTREQLIQIMAGASIGFIKQQMENQPEADQIVQDYLKIIPGFQFKTR